MPLQKENKVCGYCGLILFTIQLASTITTAPSHHFHCHVACPVKKETIETSDEVLSPKLHQIKFFIITIYYNCHALQ